MKYTTDFSWLKAEIQLAADAFATELVGLDGPARIPKHDWTVAQLGSHVAQMPEMYGSFADASTRPSPTSIMSASTNPLAEGPHLPTSTRPDFSRSRAFATALTAAMTLAEKAAQLTQVEKNSITPDEVAEFGIGSVLSGCGGNPEPNTALTWRQMVDDYVAGAARSRLGIPLLYGTDSIHGHANVVGATIFPHHIGLGATGDVELVERVYRATALETAATGARWAFAPTLAVAVDARWGRTYEAFGDDPELVAELGAAAVRGLQGESVDQPDAVAACLKHYVGDGGTTWGSLAKHEWIEWWEGWRPHWQMDQGDTRIDEATLRSVHLRPYLDGLDSGALTVMASYSSWNGERLHAHRWLLTDVLKGELGFDGLVISDWLGIDQLDADPYRCVVMAITAGVDMVMVPFEYRRFMTNVIAAVEAADLDVDRVDDAVRRIITVKHALGLFDDNPIPAPPVDVVGCQAHRSLARKAVAASAVLLTDPDDVLPISGGNGLVAGAAADDIGLQCGGWTIEWQGGSGPITVGTSVVDALRQAEADLEISFDPSADFGSGQRAPVGIAVIAEPPYSEGAGDRADLALPAADIELVAGLRQHVDRLVLIILSGRPLLLDSVVVQCDAIVAAWLPGTEGAGIADVITGAEPFTGQLPRHWPRTDTAQRNAVNRVCSTWRRGHGVTR